MYALLSPHFIRLWLGRLCCNAFGALLLFIAFDAYIVYALSCLYFMVFALLRLWFDVFSAYDV